MQRLKIYQAIDTERDYQDSKWGVLNDPNYVSYEPSQFLIDIEIHLAKAKLANYNIDKNEVMSELRKIAALAVKCGEVHGMTERKQIVNQKI
jgi:hypothetical protein